MLTNDGITEIEKIADGIMTIKPDVIITSSMNRCKQSLDIILQHLDTSTNNKVEILYLDTIKGINHGEWEARNKDQLIGKDLLSWFAKWNSYIFAKSPGGESLAELIIRANKLLENIDKKL